MDSHTHPKYDREWQILCLCAQVQPNEKQIVKLQHLLAETVNWDALFSFANNHCVTQMLARNLLAHGTKFIPATIKESLRSDTHQYAIKANYHLHSLRRLLRAFADHGVQAIPLKGAVLALQLYGDLVWRDSVDLDIAVNPEQLTEARAVLVSLGYTLQSEIPAIADSELVKHDNAMVYRSPQGSCSVDLHWRFTKLMEGFEILRWDFWQRLQPFQLAEDKIDALATEDLLILLTLHAAKDQCDRLKHFCDFTAFVHAYPDYDWEAALVRGAQLGLERQLLLLLFISDQLWSLELPEWLGMRFQKDRKLLKLERIAFNNLFYHDQPFAMSLNRVRFVLATRLSRFDYIAYFVRYLFQPNPFDWAWVRLPAPLTFLYPLVHVCRLTVSATQRFIGFVK